MSRTPCEDGPAARRLPILIDRASARLHTGHPVPLRGADWRFLLPSVPECTFRHLVLIGGRAGLAERIVEAGIADQVSDVLPAERSADAVAILRGGRTSWREIAGCLVPGGVLYSEVGRRSLGYLVSRPDRLRRSLREAGLFPTGLYAVLPDFADHRAYLPLDISGALGWYVRTLYSAFSPWQHLLEAGLRGATGLDGRRFAAYAPRLAVTAVAGESRYQPPSVLAHPALPAELRGRELHPALLTSGGDRVVMLPFAVGGMQPEAVLKVPRLPGFSGRTENEQATLATIRSRLDPALRSTVPRPLGTLRLDGVTVGIESYAPGESLFRSSERWGVPRQDKVKDLRLATEWLTTFHLQAQVSRLPWDAAGRNQWMEGPFDAYRQAFELTGGEERLFAAARVHADSLDGTPFPLVMQHRDFTVWNITRSGSDLAVLDWEGCRVGPALCDLLHFVTHWHETVRHAHDEAARQRSFRKLLFEPHREDLFRRAIYHEIGRYMEQLEIDRRYLPLLLVYTWVELTLRRFDQQRVQGESLLDVRADNRNFPFVAILAHHVEQLFAEEDFLRSHRLGRE